MAGVICAEALTPGITPAVTVVGEKLVIGGQTVSYDGAKTILGQMAGPLKMKL